MTTTEGLKNKICLVTGGSSGIGRSTALIMAREGATVVVADVNVPGGEQTVDMVKEAGSDAIFVRCDVTKATEVDAMVTKTVESYGRLDCAFNNAGVEGTVGPLAELAEEEWDRVIDINLKGVFLCMKSEIRQMEKQEQGAIVNTASVAGLIGSATIPAYGASKHGVVGVTKAAAVHYAPAGIRINAVCPAVIRTSMVNRVLEVAPEIEEQLIAEHPAGRFGMPEEVAEAVVWLCSDAASFVTGHAMTIDGGFVAR